MYVDNYTLLTVYYALAFPYLQYPILSWGTATKPEIKCLKTLQTKLLKLLNMLTEKLALLHITLN